LGDILDSLRQIRTIHCEVASRFYSNPKQAAAAVQGGLAVCMMQCIGQVGLAKIPAASQQLAHCVSIADDCAAVCSDGDEAVDPVRRMTFTHHFY
jgi:hypothetical protein